MTDELLAQMDLWINVNREGSKAKAGLTLHHSTTDNLWHVYYGKKGTKKYESTGTTLPDALRVHLSKVDSGIKL